MAHHPRGSLSRNPMIVTTTENVSGARVTKNLGQVFGLTVRSRSLGGNIAAGLKSLVGGEIRSYVKLNEDARRQAVDRMVENAAAMGANAVSMMRFDSTEMGRTMSEIVAYGTAQLVEWETPPSDSPARAEPPCVLVVVAVVVVAGIVIALFGWDRYSRQSQGGGRRSRRPTDRGGVCRPRDRPSNAGVVRQGYRPPGVPSRRAV